MESILLSKAANDLQISINEICTYFAKKDIHVKPHPNTQINLVHYSFLEAEYKSMPDPYFLKGSSFIRDVTGIKFLGPYGINVWKEITISARKRLIKHPTFNFLKILEEATDRVIFLLLLTIATKKSLSDVINNFSITEPDVAKELSEFNNPNLIKELKPIWENEVFSIRASYIMESKGVGAYIMHSIEPFLLIDPYETNSKGRKRKRY